MKKRKAPERTVVCHQHGCTAKFFTDDQRDEHWQRVHKDEVFYTLWIGQRARGVYLAHVMEHEGDVDVWDAFPTLKKAKRWCAKQVGRTQLLWQVEDDGNQWVIERLRTGGN